MTTSKIIPPITGQESFFDWVAKQSHDTRIIATPVMYVRNVGRNAAELLAQATWWCDMVDNPERKFYHTQSQWQKELYMTRQEVRSAIRKLEAVGVMRVTVGAAPNGDKTTWYEVDFQKILQWWPKPTKEKKVE